MTSTVRNPDVRLVHSYYRYPWKQWRKKFAALGDDEWMEFRYGRDYFVTGYGFDNSLRTMLGDNVVLRRSKTDPMTIYAQQNKEVTVKDRVRIVKNPAVLHPSPGRVNYPWDEWQVKLDRTAKTGEWLEFRRGRDFLIPVDTFRISLHNRYRASGGVQTTTSITDDPDVLYVRRKAKLKACT